MWDVRFRVFGDVILSTLVLYTDSVMRSVCGVWFATYTKLTILQSSYYSRDTCARALRLVQHVFSQNAAISPTRCQTSCPMNPMEQTPSNGKVAAGTKR